MVKLNKWKCLQDHTHTFEFHTHLFMSKTEPFNISASGPMHDPPSPGIRTGSALNYRMYTSALAPRLMPTTLLAADQ